MAKILHPFYAALCVAGPQASIVLYEDKKKPATKAVNLPGAEASHTSGSDAVFTISPSVLHARPASASKVYRFKPDEKGVLAWATAAKEAIAAVASYLAPTDLLFSYAWADVFADKSKKVLVAKKEADKQRMTCFFDERDARGETEEFMRKAVENAEIFVAFVSSK